MLFSSIEFIHLFLPVFLTLYLLTPSRFRNAVALAGSLVFYAWGAPRFVFVLGLGCLADFLLARGMTPGHASPAARRWRLALALALNLGMLGYFKYANFLVDNASAVLQALGFDGVAWHKVILPIGISFFTFQRVSYLLDVYRGSAPPAARFGDYLLFITMFPQLIAGPIVRYHDVAEQIRRRRLESRVMLDGVWRFALGLAKKVLVADPLAQVADLSFGRGVGELAPSLAWVGLACYAFQIYFDFSGYSDMAIGLGKMLGFRFLENFNRPYISRNITEFWRRWHISLSNAMRDYLYVPLGGNRKGVARTYVNLWLVFLISGLWHGASWNFVLWGGLHGLFLSLDKAVGLERLKRVPGIVSVPATFLLVCLGWVLFRAKTLALAGSYYASLFGFSDAAWPSAWREILGRETCTVLVFAALACFLPALFRRLDARGALAEEPSTRTLLLRFAVAIPLLALSSLALVVSDFHPFIYFQF